MVGGSAIHHLGDAAAWRDSAAGQEGRVSVQRKIKVAVVFGGRGPEHAVSCMGGGNMLSAIDRDRYEVIPVGITREGNWVLTADEPGRLAITGGELPSVEDVAEPGGQVVPWAGQPGRELAASPPGQIPRLLGEVDWPLFVKPARGGSSIGTSKAADMAGLHDAIETARRYDPKVLVEAAIDGAEIECSVLEGASGGPPDTSMPGQLLIEGGEEFWDFEAKYLDEASGMAIPAPIPAEARDEVRRLAAEAFDAVSCEGLARVDFFYTPDGQIMINEINTIPGLSPASYFQKMWEASGLPFSQLIDRLLQTALNKRPGLR